jgi:hypothetical protein
MLGKMMIQGLVAAALIAAAAAVYAQAAGPATPADNGYLPSTSDGSRKQGDRSKDGDDRGRGDKPERHVEGRKSHAPSLDPDD